MSNLSSALSVICLAIIGLACLVGVFHHRYDDTLGERLGMSLIGMWVLARLPVKMEQALDLMQGDTEPVHLMLHIGLASFALGMAWAKWLAHGRQRRHAESASTSSMVPE